MGWGKQADWQKMMLSRVEMWFPGNHICRKPYNVLFLAEVLPGAQVQEVLLRGLSSGGVPHRPLEAKASGSCPLSQATPLSSGPANVEIAFSQIQLKWCLEQG